MSGIKEFLTNILARFQYRLDCITNFGHYFWLKRLWGVFRRILQFFRQSQKTQFTLLRQINITKYFLRNLDETLVNFFYLIKPNRIFVYFSEIFGYQLWFLIYFFKKSFNNFSKIVGKNIFKRWKIILIFHLLF